MKKKEKTPINDQHINEFINMGLTKKIVTNLIKKSDCYEDVLKKVPEKLDDIKARDNLKKRLGKDMKMEKRKLPKINKFKIENPGQVFVYDFPMLPSVNHMYMTVRGSRQLKPKYKVLFLDLQEEMDKEIRKQGWRPTYKTFLIAKMRFYMDSNRIKDNHNMFKFLFDVMDGILYDDDYYILPQVLDIQVDKDNPRIEFELSIKDRMKYYGIRRIT
jgi:crossover junction endodeoxyribonuclease RusA